MGAEVPRGRHHRDRRAARQGSRAAVWTRDSAARAAARHVQAAVQRHHRKRRAIAVRPATLSASRCRRFLEATARLRLQLLAPIETRPNRQEIREAAVDPGDQPAAVGEDLRIIRPVEEQPSAEEDPADGRRMLDSRSPTPGHRSGRRSVDGGVSPCWMNPPFIDIHCVRKPRHAPDDELLKLREVRERALLIAVGTLRRQLEADPRADGVASPRRRREQSDRELRLPACPLVEHAQVSGAARSGWCDAGTAARRSGRRGCGSRRPWPQTAAR